MSRTLISVVIPVLNECANVSALLGKLIIALNTLGKDWEVLFIDDGSTDGTLELIRGFNQSDKRIKAISLSRNFGKDLAIAAGLRYATGNAAIVMDADLQHPPALLVEFVAKWREGYHVVYGHRINKYTRTRLRAFASRLYYGLFQSLTDTPLLNDAGVGDFWLLDRRAIDTLNSMNEVTRFTQGLCSWIGFRSIGVPYVVNERTIGESRWTYRRLLRHAINGITAFSTLPLRISAVIGLLISIGAIVYSIVVIIETLVFGKDLPGFPSLIISVMFLGGAQLITLGILGEYLARVFDEVKRRPLFVIAEEIGAGPPAKFEAIKSSIASDELRRKAP